MLLGRKMEDKRKIPVPPRNLQNSQNNVARNFPPPPPNLKKEQIEEVKEEKVEPQISEQPVEEKIEEVKQEQKQEVGEPFKQKKKIDKVAVGLWSGLVFGGILFVVLIYCLLFFN